jgi:hypothetical protein
MKRRYRGGMHILHTFVPQRAGVKRQLNVIASNVWGFLPREIYRGKSHLGSVVGHSTQHLKSKIPED